MKILILFLLLLINLNVFGQSYNCSNLPKKYNSYDSAIKIIQSASFEYKDYTNQFSSSWIGSIGYFSCDKKSGFLIVHAHDGKSYIHEGVPINLWRGLKSSKSKGSYYSNNIRGSYLFKLK